MEDDPVHEDPHDTEGQQRQGQDQESDGPHRLAVALREDGSMWSWGDNSYGQAGDGTTAGPRGARVTTSFK